MKWRVGENEEGQGQEVKKRDKERRQKAEDASRMEQPKPFYIDSQKNDKNRHSDMLVGKKQKSFTLVVKRRQQPFTSYW